METKTIYFYDAANDSVREEDIYLNNFAPSPFIADDGFNYPTVEHYYQVN